MLNIGCCCFRIEGCSDGSTALVGVYFSRVLLVFSATRQQNTHSTCLNPLVILPSASSPTMEHEPGSSPPSSAPSSTYAPYRISLFTYVTRTTSTSYTTDIRLFFAITVLSSILVYSRGFGWEFLLLLLGGGMVVWKTAEPREGMEFKRVRRGLRG